jgi:hypothetical protein
MDSRIVSGKTGFAEAYALTGPPSGGKSFIALRHLRFLGQKAENLVQPLPASYFLTPPPQNAEGARPVTAACRGAKLVVPKEMPVKPIVAEALKGILDPRDVDVSARQNHASRHALRSPGAFLFSLREHCTSRPTIRTVASWTRSLSSGLPLSLLRRRSRRLRRLSMLA